MRTFPLLLLPSLLLAQQNWRSWSGSNDGNRYSPLTQVNKANVKQLKVAWEYKSGDADPRGRTAIQCTPIIVDGVLYATTPTLDAIALDAATGKEIWRFAPPASRFRGVNRGVMLWEEKGEKRIFYAAGAQLFALDAKTGKAIPSFAADGRLDLSKDLDRDPPGAFNGATSPGVIYKDLIIIGSSVGEGPRMAAPGHIRAYDVRTGKRRWIFHTIPHPGEFGYETWPKDAWKTSGGTNNWGGMSLDETKGIVYVSLGSPSFDYYGADRVGDNLFGNSLVALDANTGKRIWHYQTVHHDIWDMDLPVNANLIQWRGKPAVAQITKQGYVFVLDRETGKPLLPVEERPFPASTIPGEVTAKTQPIPLKPPPFSPQHFEPSDITPEVKAHFTEMSKDWLNQGMYIPASRLGTVMLPGTVGGGLWGGAAADPAKGILYVNSQNLPSIMQIIDAPAGSPYPYQIGGYRKLRDEKGNPGVKPPWGQLTAIDLNKGEFLWQKVLGKNDTTEKDVGTENFGGPILTAGGLVFIGATRDEMFRAFDAATGTILWEAKLPAGGYATPATYSLNGKQYIVIACGGGARLTTKSGDSYVAFALP
ncbi:MAG: pyrroloquinoline quinone-dependent dehydrogenase [Acidobacteria bacterium]|nr:pyrroloquinoline quinone-dependent dehydrogenase [Acidobacteriota bacterium]